MSSSGRVPVEGIDLTCLIYPVEEIFYRFIVYKEFDVAEISFAKYSALIAQGNTDFFALPIFPSRVFRHSSVYVRDDGPIKKITDLKGRKVGIPEWAQTAAVYSRGFLPARVRLRALDLLGAAELDDRATADERSAPSHASDAFSRHSGERRPPPEPPHT